MSADPFAPSDGSIYGPIYFGTLLSTGLYGVTCMQTFFYYVHYPNDSLRMKCFIATLWAFDTINESLVTAGVYKYIMAGLESPLGILEETPEIVVLSATLLSMLSQGFLVYRIYVFSGKNIVAPILWFVQMIYQIVAVVRYVAKAFYSANGSLHVSGSAVLNGSFFKNIIISCLSLAAAVDVLIAIAMTFLLLRQRTGFSSTAHILQRLTMFAVNTGIWTATFAVLEASLMHAFSTNLIYVVFGFPLASLYCNTLLANLNARSYIRSEATLQFNAGAEMMNMSSPASGKIKALNQSGKMSHDMMSPRYLKIRKTTEVVTLRDADRSTTPENSV